MIYSEVKGNIFCADKKYYLAHCIAADARMGAGIAVSFVHNFPYIKDLRNNDNIKVGTCVKIKRVLNLITKRISTGKPTYQSLINSLLDCKRICEENNIKFLAMPKIGCGLDRLQWRKVTEIIQGIFKDMDIEIKIYIL